MKYKYASVFLFLIIFSACTNGPIKESTTDSSNNWAMLGFEKADSVNPVLVPGTNTFVDPITKKSIAWEAKDVFNPAIVVRHDTLFMLYRAQDKIGLPGGTSRIGRATSVDGLHFTKLSNPVFYPLNDSLKKYEWQGGAEDPRIVEDEQGVYYMTYTAYDGNLARLLIASSKDLIHWNKHGSVFTKAFNGKYLNLWSKSGSIVSSYVNGKIVATKINGKYWMYWGDQNIWAAISTDLINWEPVEMVSNEKPPITLKGQALNMPLLKIVVPTRDKMFDADLVESGPPAMLTDQGILLIYNSRNLKSIGDTSLPDGTYTGGQVLLDKNDPTKILKRLDHYFFKPDKPYELTGQVNNVCFLEGLANYQGKWFLYYGTADSKIAVAVRKK
ncbi:MAG: glycoside hydrolase family 130 protein [Bacteroidetes bacterium]|nr:glycoside hydrolase family 130 protein [Bacteroidota bacterium]